MNTIFDTNKNTHLKKLNISTNSVKYIHKLKKMKKKHKNLFKITHCRNTIESKKCYF